MYVFLLFSPIRSTVCAGTTGFKKDAVISYLIDVSHEKQVIIAIAVGWREFISCVIKSSTSTIKSFTFVFFHSCLSLLSLSCSRINILSCLCAAFTAFSACYISRNFHFASWYLILKPFICRHRRQRASFIAAVFTPAVSLFKIVWLTSDLPWLLHRNDTKLLRKMWARRIRRGLNEVAPAAASVFSVSEVAEVGRRVNSQEPRSTFTPA